MLLFFFLLAASLQPCPPYSGAYDGAIHVCGHAYRLKCTRSGVPRECTAARDTPAEVDHFELREEDKEVMFERSAPPRTLFTDVGISSTGYPDHPQLFTIDVGRHADSPESASALRYTHYFQATASGLTEFHPALGCGQGTGAMLSNLGKWPASGLAFACEFNSEYFRFATGLQFDFDRHEVVLAPQPDRLWLLGRTAQLTPQAPVPAILRVYSDHDENSQHSRIRLNRGQRSRMVGMWSPVQLITKDEIATVTYDPAKLWLQIQLKHQKYWISGQDSFRAIGLSSNAAP